MKEDLSFRAKDGRRIAIRKATLSDVPTIIENFQKVADEKIYLATEQVSPEQKERIKARVSDSNALFAVAEVDGNMVGHLVLGPYAPLRKASHVFSLSMSVIGGYRGSGVGSALMTFALEWAREKGIAKIVLEVFSTNTRAIKLYEKFGFQVEGVRKKQYFIEGRFVDEISMGLFLK